MVDLMDAVAAVAVLAAITLGFIALSATLDRKSLRRELKAEKRANDAMTIRLEEVKKQNLELQRENGRIVAEKRAAKPKRDPATGRFISRKSTTVTPISCG